MTRTVQAWTSILGLCSFVRTGVETGLDVVLLSWRIKTSSLQLLHSSGLSQKAIELSTRVVYDSSGFIYSPL